MTRALHFLIATVERLFNILFCIGYKSWLLCFGVELTKTKTVDKMGSMKNKNKKVGKASVVFTRLYGHSAYEAWKVREAEIDGLAKSGQYSVSSICHLREDNYRRMKLGKSGIVSARSLHHQRLAA